MKEGRGWYGRVYATVEGERVRVCRALKTENKAPPQEPPPQPPQGPGPKSPILVAPKTSAAVPVSPAVPVDPRVEGASKKRASRR